MTHRAVNCSPRAACGERLVPAAGPGDAPFIEQALLAAGHDGLPDLVLRIRYENGALGNVIVNNAAGIRLMARCGAEHIEALAGQSWREVRNALLEE